MSQVTIPGLPAGGALVGTELLEISNSGISESTTAAAIVTLGNTWTADKDAQGFDLRDLSNLEFRDTTLAPAITERAIYADANSMYVNVPTGDTILLQINGVTHITVAAVNINFEGNNLLGINALTLTGIINFPDGVRQTFNPDATTAGINVGANTGDPSSTANGDVYYNSTANELRARIDDAWVDIGGSGSAQTPWLSDIDADGFDLTDLSNIEFRTTTGTPGASTPAFYFTGGELRANVATGNTILLQINGGTDYQFSATQADFNANNLVNFGYVESAAAIPATVGAARFGNDEFIEWRDTGNTLNARFGLTSGDNMLLDQADFEIQAVTGDGVNFTCITGIATGSAGNNLANFTVRTTNASSIPVNALEIDFVLTDATNDNEGSKFTLRAFDANNGGFGTEVAAEFGWSDPEGDGFEFAAWFINAPIIIKGPAPTNQVDYASLWWNGDDLQISCGSSGCDIRVNGTNEYSFNDIEADFQGNDLTEIGLLEQRKADTTAIFEQEANHTTPVNGQVISQINGLDDSSTGVVRTYTQIRSLIEDPTNLSEDGEMFFSVIEAGTLTDYISLNNTLGLDITMHKPVDMNNNSITNVNGPTGITFQSGEDIRADSLDLILGILAGGSVQLTVNSGVEYSFDVNSAGFNGNSIVDLASIDDSSGLAQLMFASVASAVNELTITNAATGNPALLTATGETNAALTLATSGTGLITLNADTVVTGQFNLDAATELTIATGAITATKSYHSVDTEADAATDDLDTINGGVEGDVLVIRAIDSARTVSVTEAGNIILSATPFAMDNVEDTLSLLYNGTDWLEISRSDNGA